jgi:hypothetical protein
MLSGESNAKIESCTAIATAVIALLSLHHTTLGQQGIVF